MSSVPRTPPLAGDKPQRYIFSCDPRLSLFGRWWLVSPAGAGIHPGSESGTCFRTNDDTKVLGWEGSRMTAFLAGRPGGIYGGGRE